MSIVDHIRCAVIIAPHPDDEILGCGGTMARLAAGGAEVHVVLMTRGRPPKFAPELVAQVIEETEAAHKLIGVTELHCLDLPAAELDALPLADVNQRLGHVLDRLQPDTLFVPFVGDLHLDHQVAFISALVWGRPRSASAPSRILAYETLSETNWYAPGITPAFIPNMFIDISGFIDRKIAAFECFASQVKPFPDERSIEAIRALATVRGAAVYRNAAEAFMTVRQID